MIKATVNKISGDALVNETTGEYMFPFRGHHAAMLLYMMRRFNFTQVNLYIIFIL